MSEQHTKMGRPLGDCEIFWQLVRDGPTPREELDNYPSLTIRVHYDIRRFNPFTFTEAVLYLGEYHSPTSVFKVWATHNRDTLHERNVTEHEVTYEVSGSFADAWDGSWKAQLQLATSPQGPAEKPDPQRELTCPRCGKDDVQNLSNHIHGPNCEV